jgi:hypothetical protein
MAKGLISLESETLFGLNPTPLDPQMLTNRALKTIVRDYSFAIEQNQRAWEAQQRALEQAAAAVAAGGSEAAPDSKAAAAGGGGGGKKSSPKRV